MISMQIQSEFVATFLIIIGVGIDILFIVKVKF